MCKLLRKVTLLLYQSYWYGNALTLTICVNANALRSSPSTGSQSAPKAGKIARRRSTTWIGDRRMSQRLGDLLVKGKIITPEELKQATKPQKEQNSRLGSSLVNLGSLTDEDATNFPPRQSGVPAI